MLDNDMHGSGVFLPELDEPEYCNAQNTCLWELHTLKVAVQQTPQHTPVLVLRSVCRSPVAVVGRGCGGHLTDMYSNRSLLRGMKM